MIEKCNSCIHKHVCVLKNHIKDNDCIDYLMEDRTHTTKFGIYDPIYIIDRYDTVNNCSQIGDGTGSKNVELIVRECFITSITIHDKAGNHLYHVQPRNLTEFENNHDKCFYWEQSWYGKSIFENKDDAVAYLESIGFKNIKIL